MNNKNYVWVIEVKSTTSKVYKPLMWTFGVTHFTGMYMNRLLARNAAKYMTENNQYNKPNIVVKYRVRKYKRI